MSTTLAAALTGLPSPALALEASYHSYDGFEETVDAFRLVSMIFADPRYETLVLIMAIAGIALGAARVAQAEADVAVARADKRPDWGFDVAYQRRADRFGDMVSAGVTVSLPLFAKHRQGPMIAANTATASAALAQQEDMRRTLLADLEAGLADHVMHHDQWMRARDTLLPLARSRADLETASYGAGRAGLLNVIEAQTMLADSELQLLDREAEVARDAVRLVLTFGGNSQ